LKILIYSSILWLLSLKPSCRVQ